MAYQVGIDLGTTYTAAAVHRDGQVEMVGLGDREAVIPSVLFVRAEGDVLTGVAANRRGLEDPERVAREFKRRLGDTTPMYLGGAPWSPHLLLSRLLRSIVDVVAEREGAYPEALAITHPANWGPFKLDLLRQAVEHAGFGDYPVTYLSEPEAAAIHYAAQQRVAPGSVVAVYDLGGGTFDAAVLRRQDDGRFTVVGKPEGIEHLGGIDFDAAVFRHVDRAVGGAVSELDANDPETISAVARLRAECVEAKEVLSSDTEVTIPVALSTVRTSVRLLRSELEAIIQPALAETISALRRALRSAGVTPEQIGSVLLVGGSSRIPLVSQLVSSELGRPVAVDAHPKHAIALGAAVAAAQSVGASTLGVASDADVTIVEAAEVGVPAAATTGPTGVAGDGAGGAKPPFLAIGAVMVLVVAALGFVLTRGGGADDPPETTTTTEPLALAGGVVPVEDRGDAWIVPNAIASIELSGLVGVDVESGEVIARANTTNIPASSQPIVTDDAVWVISRDSPILVEKFARDDAALLGTVELPFDGEPDILHAIRSNDAIWLAATRSSGTGQFVSRVYRIAQGSAQANLTVDLPLDIRPSTLATDGDVVWISGRDADFNEFVVRIEGDAADEPVALPIDLVDQMAFHDGSLWVVASGTLHQVDADDLSIIRSTPLAIDDIGSPSSFMFTDSTVSFVAEDTSEEVVLVDVDRETGDVTTTPLEGIVVEGFLSFAVAIDPDGVRWVFDSGSAADERPGRLLRIAADGDVTSTEVSPTVGFAGDSIAIAGDHLAISDAAGGGRMPQPTVRLFDRADGELVDTVRADLYPITLTDAGDRALVTDLRTDTVGIVDADGIDETVEVNRPLWPAIRIGGAAWTLTTTGLEIIDLDDPGEPEIVDVERRSPLMTDGTQVVVRTDPYSLLDPATGAVLNQFPSNYDGLIQASSEPLSFFPELVAFGALWEGGGDQAFRIDLATGAVAPVAVDGAAFAVGDTELWATDDAGGVHRIDPRNGVVANSARVGSGSGRVVAAGDIAWYLDDTRTIRQLNQVDGSEVIAVELPEAPIGAVFAAGSLWVSLEGKDQVLRIDPQAEFPSDAIQATIETGRRPTYLVADPDGIWVALQGDLALARIDPEADEVVDTVEIDS